MCDDIEETFKNRISRYGLSDSTKLVQNIITIPFNTGKEATELEKKLHKKYHKDRIDPIKMKEHHIVSGFSECYPMEMLPTLLQELHWSQLLVP